jgi:hypothetical protein
MVLSWTAAEPAAIAAFADDRAAARSTLPG